METDVHSSTTWAIPETFSSGRTPDDLNLVFVKIETDEWHNVANVFYSACAQSEQTLHEEMHKDHNKQDSFNFANEKAEQIGCEVIHQDLTRQDGFELASVKLEQIECEVMHQDYTRQDGFEFSRIKLEQTECEVMHQDDTRQAAINSICVNPEQLTADSNANTEQSGLISVCWKTKHSVNRNTDQRCVPINSLSTECGQVKQFIITNMDKGNTTNDYNSVCGKRGHTDNLKSLENHAKQADLNSVFVTREEIEMSNIDQNCAQPTIVNCEVGKTLKTDHDCNLNIPRDSNCEQDESGLPAIKPDFMKAPSYRTTDFMKGPACRADGAKAVEEAAAWSPMDCIDSDSDEEQTTDLERKKQAQGEELLVWNEDKNARELGLIRDKNLLLKPKYVNGEEVYQCMYCKTAFTTAIPYVHHLRRKHGGDKLTSNDLQVLDQWLQENNQKYLKKYSKRLNLTTSNTTLNSISNVKHNKSDISHSVCENQVTSAILQTKNVENTHENMYNGEVCNTTSINSSQMKTNMKIHTGKRPHTCGVCGYACKFISTLKRHMIIHTEERPFTCEVCGYECCQSGDLKRHMRIHTGERLYKCTVCGKAFNLSDHLRLHMRIHTGERLYKCDVCGYACNKSNDLKRHVRIHTGERPYKCEVCSYACNQSGNLNKHMRIHTGERLYKCAVCSYALNRSDALKRHMMIHTGERVQV